MLLKYILFAMLVIMTSLSKAQELEIPTPGQPLYITSQTYEIVGNYPSNLAAWKACVQMLSNLNADSVYINYTCKYQSAEQVPLDGDYSLIFSGGYYSHRWSDGVFESYWINIMHCPDNGNWKYLVTANSAYCYSYSKNIPVATKGVNQGSTCVEKGTQSCGEPINIATGNMWHVQEDFSDRPGGALSLKRTYNSQIFKSVRSNLFGGSWTVPYDAKLTSVAASSIFNSQTCHQLSDGSPFPCDLNAVSDPLVSAPAIELSRGDGKFYVFNHVASDYQGDKDTDDRLSIRKAADGTVLGFEYSDAQSGALEGYDLNGRLLSITTQPGIVHRLTYTDGTTNDTHVGRYPGDAPACNVSQEGDVQPAGRLACVTDVWGRQINFKYDLKGRVAEFLDPAGHSYLYEYDGATGGCVPGNERSAACAANNLTKVTFADGATKQYLYNEQAYINSGCSMPSIGYGFGPFASLMTGLVDELNSRYLTWQYNCRGQAWLSTMQGHINQVGVLYDQSSIGVSSFSHIIPSTGPADQRAEMTAVVTPVLINDVYKIGNFDVPCVGCGSIKSRTFDANGNVATTTDFGGSVTKYTYDLSRNLETSRIEASGTASARTITTVWHPTLRFPGTIAEPKRITTYMYDDRGNVLTKTEQATSDASGASGTAAAVVGAARTWTYTYNAAGQLTSQTGPRKEVSDKTTYFYDARGNPASVINPLGQVTAYSGYDENGKVGRIVEPNGLTTDFTYTLRGAVASRTVSDGVSQEMTYFDYDPAGQLIKQTQPDGSWLKFGYDVAHRLVSVSDSAGNSIAYTLDLQGNRIGEQAKDPSGVLTRQVTRVFDNLNQMTKVTGSAQ